MVTLPNILRTAPGNRCNRWLVHAMYRITKGFNRRYN